MIRPTPLLNDVLLTVSDDDASWYNWWVRRQIERESEELYSVMPEPEAETKHPWMSSFITVWRKVWMEAAMLDSSVDGIITHLL